MQKITPFLWFDGVAEEAVNHYLSIFKSGEVLSTTPGPGGKPLVLTFRLEGQEFIALNGGPMFKFTEAISLHVACDTQAELDALWVRLGEGGEPGRCGWLKDRYGLSWQIIPRVLSELLFDRDPARAQRVMQAMLAMNRLDIAGLQAAHAGATS